MISLDAFSELLAALYAAPLQPERWERFLDLLCEHTRSRSSFLICAESGHSLSVRAQGGAPHSAASISEYAANHTMRDPFMLPLIRSAKTGVIDCEELLPRAALENSDMYRYVHYPMGYRYPGMVALTCTLRRLEVISLWRSEDEGYLEGDSVRLLQLLVPHLQSAMAIRRALGTAKSLAAGAEAMADASVTPTFLLSDNGEMLHLNAAARRLLREGDGLILRGGTICAVKRAMQEPLRQLLSRAPTVTEAFGGPRAVTSLALERPSGRRPLQLLAFPVPREGTGRNLLLATDPESPIVLRDDVVRQHYSFTQAETQVANGLLTGYSLEEIAALRKVKISTVRDQVKSMLAKTRTGKQAEMVRLLLTLPQVA